MTGCGFGCSGDDVAVHNGWFRCTPESRAMLADERKLLDADERMAELIEQSSLGTPGAKSLRARVSDEQVDEVRRKQRRGGSP